VREEGRIVLTSLRKTESQRQDAVSHPAWLDRLPG
jgi:hypothetical protein